MRRREWSIRKRVCPISRAVCRLRSALHSVVFLCKNSLRGVCKQFAPKMMRGCAPAKTPLMTYALTVAWDSIEDTRVSAYASTVVAEESAGSWETVASVRWDGQSLSWTLIFWTASCIACYLSLSLSVRVLLPIAFVDLCSFFFLFVFLHLYLSCV